jgi:ribonuclease HI
MGVQRCVLKIDSKVIAGEIEKECIARDETLERYLAVVRRMEGFFKAFTAQHIERAKNTEADELAKAAARKAVKTVEPEPRMINVV